MYDQTNKTKRHHAARLDERLSLEFAKLLEVISKVYLFMKNMTLPKKRPLLFFLGAVFGLLFFALVAREINGYDNYIPYFIESILGFYLIPAIVIVDVVLELLCRLLNSNQCVGLFFDGGPLEWAEFLGVYIISCLVYGLVFLGIGDLWLKLKQKK